MCMSGGKALKRTVWHSTAVADTKYIVKVAVTFSLDSIGNVLFQEIFVPFTIPCIPTPSKALLDCVIHNVGQLICRVTKYPTFEYGTTPAMDFSLNQIHSD